MLAAMASAKLCSACNAEIPAASRFCPQCGAAQALSCTACGQVNPAGSRFCSQCGTRLGEAAPPAPTAPPAPVAAARAVSSAERRQLTVMFCDLVGSTALSTRLDPEDLRDVIAAYHKCAADVVARSGGFIAKYMGDGVLIYFGYPEAREADAENAVRTALAIIEAVGALAIGGKHQVRIGIATGLVVVGELVGTGEAQERNVVGETPNLAARLQSIAAPNTVVIAASTRRLTGAAFEYEPIEPGQLKGFDGPVAAWRVLREHTMQSRFEALRAASIAPLVGREEELELLVRRWQQAKAGEGRVVLLSGEPGIGKSRLTAALVDAIASEHPMVLRYFCLPHHQGSALQPVVAQLQHAAGLTRDDTPATRRIKVEEVLAQGSENVGATMALLSDLLALDIRPEGATPMDPQRKRAQVLAALIDQLTGLARRGPILMLFEDAQWSDPTSLELFTLTVERLQALPILLIITHRPDFQPPWAGQPHVTTMALNRLSRRERLALVDHVTGGKSLPQALLDQIVERTDGVPLFVEELTKAVLESEQMHEDDDRYVLDQPAQPLAIPTTLQASLMARVDRLGSAREVLQIGAAIGREFSYELIAAVAGLSDNVLQDALMRLTEAELLFARGTPPDAVYSFKHALVQDTAYSTMLRARRQQLHGAIAQLLEKRFPDMIASTPEIIAQQFEGAGRSEQAIRYWRQAGDRDLRRFAMKEAIAHYGNALRVVMSLPESTARSEQELAACLALALAEQIAGGPGSSDSAAHYRRADALSRQLSGHGREKFLANWGLWLHCFMTEQADEAFRRADEMISIAREVDDPDLLMEAYHAQMPGLQRRGNHRMVREASDEVIRRYDRQRHRDHAFLFGGHDARVCARTFRAMSLWGLGLLDQAHATGQKAIEDARDLGHAFSIAHAMHQAAMVFVLLDDVATCQAIAAELLEIAERNKFPWPLTHARFHHGWLAARRGDHAAGIKQMAAAAEEPSAGNRRPVLLAVLAQAMVRAGRFEDAIAVLDRIEKVQTDMQFMMFASDAQRLRGEAFRQLFPADQGKAEACFQQAIAVAREQQCRTFELRAAVSLAQLRRDQNRRAEARELLAGVYNAFTEGFGRPDLQTAKALLAELS
jgi:class 3 adenylate cyclase/tetratricopeptide (TPR) repeat protein